MTADIIVKNLLFQVEYATFGVYMPATWHDPAEYPVYEITLIKSGEPLLNILDSGVNTDDIQCKLENTIAEY